MDEFITEEFPILKGPDDRVVARLRKARKRIERVFSLLALANDVVIVCGTALEAQNVEHDTEVATVLRRYVSDPLFAQMKTLHKVIVKLGGVTLFSEERNRTRRTPMRSLPKTNKASAIIHCLVLGLDPETGEELPEDCVVNKITVNRALLAGINALEQVEARNARRALLPGNVGRNWTQTEEAELRDKFTAGMPIPEIAFQHGRTVRAIEARLEKAGLLTADQRATTNSFLTVMKKDEASE